MRQLVYKPPKWIKNAESSLLAQKKYGERPDAAAMTVEQFLHPEQTPHGIPWSALHIRADEISLASVFLPVPVSPWIRCA